jgi:hypothetical protein
MACYRSCTASHIALSVHDLVLHARVAGYEPAWCDALYERREIFEVTNKTLCRSANFPPACVRDTMPG